MKTLSAVIREIFAARRTDPCRPPVAKETDAEPENQNSLTQKTQNNETETDENRGNPVVDNSSSGENHGTDQEFKEPTDRGTGQRGVRPEDTSEFQEAVKRAFEEGVKAGRNAKIEETYFPKQDDGIPHFRGTTPSAPSNDIFSLAREA